MLEYFHFPWSLRLGAVACLAMALTGCGKTNANSSQPPQKGQQGQKGGRGGSGQQAVPVAVAKGDTRDLPVYLNGLGSVATLNMVVIKSRIDGQLVHVPIREGQEAKKGQLLTVLDHPLIALELSQPQLNL